MANKGLFRSKPGKMVAPADTINDAGGLAYSMPDEHALAQLACTGCLNGTYYASAETQLDLVLAAASKCAPEYVARVAVHARRKGFMKDMPALLLAQLAARGADAKDSFEVAFPLVIDNGRMLRTFIQVLRSGQLGRKSIPQPARRMVRNWIRDRPVHKLLEDSIGGSPSLADIIKMVRPKPESMERRALHGWVLGKQADRWGIEDENPASFLPLEVQAYEDWKRDPDRKSKPLPAVPWLMLIGQDLSDAQWRELAVRMQWHALRMNLNTLQRHGALNDPEMVESLAAKLRDPDVVRKVKAFPYQLMVAYRNSDGVPLPLRESLQDAMEVATENVPEFEGGVAVCVDTSGSMSSSITGDRGSGATSAVRCVDVAALVASAVLRRNPGAVVVPYDTEVRETQLNPRDSVMTNATKLALNGGGTASQVALQHLIDKKVKVGLVVYVSDNQSWFGSQATSWYGRGAGTSMAEAWEAYKSKVNINAKLVCIDLTPQSTLQVKEREDVLNIGGFSDAVFEVIAAFARGGLDPEHWVGVVKSTELK